ncbi:hypothetical protein K474DRAFT_1631069 [Panus rudis PR-1116 ss-1]|nr:hypothetical protein K474DRAFT_1631069 [Panus rudis PR-1116 ss-1]
MPPTLKPIDPPEPRWEPTQDPNDIVIPGLDTTAPVNDQIEQIEQLITIKLQNLDAIFSKIQQILNGRILPAVKRYAIATEPVREAANFWTTFFEQAAQIRVPTYEDYEIPPEGASQSESSAPQTEETSIANSSSSSFQDQTTTPTRSFNPDGSSSEVSFMPGHAAISSTPATTSRHRAQPGEEDSGYGDPTPSWAASLESPLLQLNREIESLGRDDHDAVSIASSSIAQLTMHERQEDEETNADITQRPAQLLGDDKTMQMSEKSKGKAREQPSLRSDILRRNASIADPSSAASISPLKLKQKTPILKKLNPYLPPDSNPAEWRGVVDLKDPSISISSPNRTIFPHKQQEQFRLHLANPSSSKPKRSRSKSPSKRAIVATPHRSVLDFRGDEDDSFDENFGMSPPVTLAFARHDQLAQTKLPSLPKLGQTPKKEAAEKIMNKLLDVERKGIFGPSGRAAATSQRQTGTGTTESSMSTLPTPPSLSKYMPTVESSSSVVDASLESLMRRVGNGFYSTTGGPTGGRGDAGNSTLTQQNPMLPSSSSQATTISAALGVEASSAHSRTIETLAALTAQASSSTASASALSYRTQTYSHSSTSSQAQPDPTALRTATLEINPFYLKDDELQPPDEDDSIDSLEEEMLQQPAEFYNDLNANYNYGQEDSFDSIQSSDDDMDMNRMNNQPFEMPPGTYEDDSFSSSDDNDFPQNGNPMYHQDSETDETLFGVPPAQRALIERQREEERQERLRLHGEHLLEDTVGIGARMVSAGNVEETPTPWPGGAAQR